MLNFQWLVLASRNFRVLCKDKMSLFILLGQVPIIAFLMLISFYQSEKDYVEIDSFSRVNSLFVQKIENAERQMTPVIPDKFWHKAVAEEKEQKIKNAIPEISELGGRQRGAIYFIFVAASIWFGIMGSCTEIVGEQHILKRELSSLISPLQYVFSKLVLFSLIVAVQTGLLVIIAPFLLKISMEASVLLWLILWLIAFSASCLGLFLSSIASNIRFALALVPLLIIPQLLFGGLIRPPVNQEKFQIDASMDASKVMSLSSQMLGMLTLQRWGFEASMNVDLYAQDMILKQNLNFNIDRKYGEFKIVSFEKRSLVNSFFFKQDFFVAVAVLLVYSFVFICLTYMRIKRKFS